MRIAFAVAWPPYPLNAGNRIRTFHLLKHASERHDVTLLTAVAAREDARALDRLRDALPQLTARAARVPSRTAPLRRCVRIVRSAVDPWPFTWTAYLHRRFGALLRSTLHEGEYDLVHCDNIPLAPAFFGLRTPPRLLNLHNVESVLVRRAAENAPTAWRRLLLRWHYHKTRDAEIRTYPFFDRIAVVSDADRAEVERSVPGLPISAVPNGVDAEWFTPWREPSEAHVMVFTGVMDWLPNVDGISFFVREVLPRIKRRIPLAELWVVGRNPSPSLVRRLEGDGVRFTGTVDDVRPYLGRARLVVVPLRIGGGTRLKILEAWAMAKAVLSTSIGAEGLPTVDGGNIALADTAEQMAEGAVALLTDADLAARLGVAGRGVVEARFGWKRIAEELLEAYEETVESGRAAAPRPSRAWGRPGGGR